MRTLGKFWGTSFLAIIIVGLVLFGGQEAFSQRFDIRRGSGSGSSGLLNFTNFLGSQNIEIDTNTSPGFVIIKLTNSPNILGPLTVSNSIIGSNNFLLYGSGAGLVRMQATNQINFIEVAVHQSTISNLTMYIGPTNGMAGYNAFFTYYTNQSGGTQAVAQVVGFIPGTDNNKVLGILNGIPGFVSVSSLIATNYKFNVDQFTVTSGTNVSISDSSVQSNNVFYGNGVTLVGRFNIGDISINTNAAGTEMLIYDNGNNQPRVRISDIAATGLTLYDVTGTAGVTITNNGAGVVISDLGSAGTASISYNSTRVGKSSSSGFDPWANDTWDLGTTDLRWQDIWLSGRVTAAGDIRGAAAINGTNVNVSATLTVGGAVINAEQTLAYTHENSGAGDTNIVVDWSLGTAWYLFATNNFNYRHTNMTRGQSLVINIQQDGTGSRLCTAINGTNFKIGTNSTDNLTVSTAASAWDIQTFYSGTNTTTASVRTGKAYSY